MNKKLSDWASLAEIISGIAVVITLVFLLLGIQANTDMTRVSVYSSLIDSINDLETNAVGDPEVSRILNAYFSNDISSLTESDVNQLHRYVHILFRAYEKAFFSEQYGVIGAEQWDRFERLICINWERVEEGGIAGLDVVLTENFLNYIEESC